MQIRNRQPWAVEIAAPNHDFFAEVDAGGTVDVEDDLGASLLEQPDNWEAVGSPGPAPVPAPEVPAVPVEGEA